MGDIKRKKKEWRRPRKLYDKTRIEEENKIVTKYGLKNKREIWKAESETSKLRRKAKALIPKSTEEKQNYFGRLNKMGFKVKEISDVLGLTKEDWLNRRLQTFVFKKGFALTPKQARQLITHKKVLVDGNVVNIPSFCITTDLENKISIKESGIKKEKIMGEENGEE